MILLSTWLVALLLGISEAPTWGWGSAEVIGLLVGAIVVAAGWVVVESRSSQPLIDMRMMRLPPCGRTTWWRCSSASACTPAFAFLPEFLQTPPSAGYGFGVEHHRTRA